MAERHQEFLDAGARVFSVSVDTPEMNAAVVEKLSLPFPLLSDPSREEAITPLGFADEKDPRLISLPGTVIFAPGGARVFSTTGSDFADRPHEDDLLEEVRKLELPPTSQAAPERGKPEPGPKAVPFEALKRYMSGAKFAVLVMRRRHRELGEEFRDDAKRYVQMLERYLSALEAVEGRRSRRT